MADTQETQTQAQAQGQTQAQGGGTQAAAPAGPDIAAKLADLEGKLSAVLKERDTLAERAKLADALQTKHDKLAADLAAIQGERDKLTGEVTSLTNEKRENAILDKLSAALPHASRSEVRRMFLGLAAEGKAERYSDDAEKTAGSILAILKSEGSALLRAPVGASGGTNPAITSNAAAQRRFLI